MSKLNKGFTLVEILIVVIILGILAAIVIPQFTEASNEARDSALVSDLQTMRSQIELYKIQHLDLYPGDDDDDGSEDTTGDFVLDMTTVTNSVGNDVAADGSVVLGPYVQQFPSNPFVSDADDRKECDTVNDGNGMPAGDGTTGWLFNYASGRIMANDTKSTTTGTLHSDL